jgi:enoyl-CoA hydratase
LNEGFQAEDGDSGMTAPHNVQELFVKTVTDGSLVIIELNRPHLLNSLDLQMIRIVRDSLEEAESTDTCTCVLLRGAGEKAFCAGGDIKMLARCVRAEDFNAAEQFFEEEYALDLYIHQFPKVLVVIADGITMGGGLGLTAGADVVIATERTRMAMPETGIGFFPDVGASKWLFSKCPEGYAEFLALTGHELKEAETVRCGLASHLLWSDRVKGLVEALKALPQSFPREKDAGLNVIRSLLYERCERSVPAKKQMEQWVQGCFSHKSSLQEIIDSLKKCKRGKSFCQGTLQTLSRRSPTALALTYLLLRSNEGRPLEEVFQVERKAASFMIRHPDYLEGIRAQVLEKDHRPRWYPKTIEEVGDLGKILE